VTPSRSHLLALRGPIKTYDWGSRTVLAGLAGRDAPAAEPEAELWLGAHPQGVAEVETAGAWVSLRDAIERSPVELLGAESVERFGRELPFLLKVLAIERPLSLQVHPDREQAAAGFARERAAGRAPDDGSYRDPRHKPELIVALEPLWVLRGLLEPAEIRRRFAAVGVAGFDRELDELGRRGVAGLREFLGALLGLSGERRNVVLGQARHAVRRPGRTEGSAPDQARARPIEPRDNPLHWLGRLLELYPEDPAALAPLFLHLVRLAPGQGLFQPPRVLHTYLAGAGVEVMASSDNVVRAGLTPKPVDVGEVMAIADVTPSAPAAIEPAAESRSGVARYASPAEEFELRRLEAGPARELALDGPPTLLLGICTRGAGRLVAADRGESLALTSGSAFAVRPGAGRLRVDGELCAYAATLGRAGRS
jgi:mannose-6-phosphate isomerase class I